MKKHQLNPYLIPLNHDQNRMNIGIADIHILERVKGTQSGFVKQGNKLKKVRLPIFIESVIPKRIVWLWDYEGFKPEQKEGDEIFDYLMQDDYVVNGAIRQHYKDSTIAIEKLKDNITFKKIVLLKPKDGKFSKSNLLKPIIIMKAEALSKAINVPVTEITGSGKTFAAQGKKYLVLTNKEATKACEDFIKKEIDKIDTEFLKDYVFLSPAEIDEYKELAGEDSKQALRDNVSDWNKFLNDVVDNMGRGYILDKSGEEREVVINKEYLFIYEQ